jgi:hypothetical protein
MPATSRERFGGYQKLVRTLLSDVDVDELEDCERILELKW